MVTQLISGKQKSPDYGIIVGTPGVGKTSLLAGWTDLINNIKYNGAPGIVLLGPENIQEADCLKFPKSETFKQLCDQVQELLNGEHDDKNIQSVGFDSLDMIEKLIHIQICNKAKVDNIDTFQWGAGRKQTIAELIKFEALVYRLVKEKCFNVWYIAHCVATDVNDPVLGLSYQNYELAMHKSKKMDAGANFVDKVSTILFCNEVLVKTEDGHAKAAGRRAMFTEFRPGHIAKNRYGLPYELPLDFAQYMHGKDLFYNGLVNKEQINNSNNAEAQMVLNEISNISKQGLIPNNMEDAITSSVNMAGNDVKELSRILNKLTTMIQ